MTLLPEVATSLHDAIQRHHGARAGRTGPPLLRGLAQRLSAAPRARARLVGVSVLAAGLAALVVVVATSYDTSQRSSGFVGSRAGTTTQVVPVAMRARFVSLRTAHAADDTLPNDVISALAHEHVGGIDVSQSRLLLSGSTITAWLVPGPQETCVILRRDLAGPSAAEAISSPCSPNSVIEQSGIVSVSGSTVVGVLPDGSGPVTATLRDGSTVKLSPNSKGAFAQDLAQPPSQLAYRGPDGAPRQISVPSPTPAPGAP